MCEYVFLGHKVLEVMKKINPDISDNNFSSWITLTKQQTLKNKNIREIKKMKIAGLEGYHKVIFATKEDAMQAQPELLILCPI